MTIQKIMHDELFEVDLQAISGVFYNIGVIAAGYSTEEIIASNLKGELIPLNRKVTKERITAVFAMLVLEFARVHKVSVNAIIENISESLYVNGNMGIRDNSGLQ